MDASFNIHHLFIWIRIGHREAEKRVATGVETGYNSIELQERSVLFRFHRLVSSSFLRFSLRLTLAPPSTTFSGPFSFPFVSTSKGKNMHRHKHNKKEKLKGIEKEEKE